MMATQCTIKLFAVLIYRIPNMRCYVAYRHDVTDLILRGFHRAFLCLWPTLSTLSTRKSYLLWNE